jgi:hemerythrin superfamily protein
MKDAGEFLLADDHAEVDILLGDALRKLAGDNAADAFKALDLFWARLAMHIRAEHLHLFPAVVKISENAARISSDSNVPETLERLRRDHDFFMHELADAIKAMRAVTSPTEREIMHDTAARLKIIRSRLADHNAVEEKLVYPLQRFLSANEREQLARSITKELTNLPPRFTTSD